MIIKTLHLISFGKFKNKTIELSDGLNIIYGKNESGKSTIMKFIYAMLQYAKEKTFEEILKKDMFKIENDIENIIKALK